MEDVLSSYQLLCFDSSKREFDTKRWLLFDALVVGGDRDCRLELCQITGMTCRKEPIAVRTSKIF